MFRDHELVQIMPKLQKFAYKLCRTSEDAEDLVQASMLKAMEKREMFTEGTSLFSWTSKIMYNLFVSSYRRRVKFESQYDPEDYIKNQQTVPMQEQHMELHKVNKAMKELSEEHRNILIMICVKGMQYKQVAKILDIPVGTVRSRLSRAREQLQERMGDVLIIGTEQTAYGSREGHTRYAM